VSRDLTAGLLAEVTAASLRPVLFYEGEFGSGGAPAYLRLWSGVGSISWNGNTWTGAGRLLGVSPIGETTDVVAKGATVSLSGMPSDLISTALGNARHGRKGRVWLGAMDGAGAVIADPFLSFEGLLDVPDIEDSGETCTISIAYESRLVELKRPRERRYTHEDQQIDYPGDLGFNFVPSIQDINIKQGRD
jgi:hypothetical protein